MIAQGKHLVTRFLMILALLCGLSSCGGKETTTSSIPMDLKDRWLDGVPCTPPCWENIQPGVTRSEEAIELVKAVSSIDSTSLQVTEVPDVDLGVILWKFSPAVTYWEGKVSYYLDQDIVDMVSLYMPDLCLHEIIDAYGEPDYLLTPETYKGVGVVNLLWEAHGFTFEVETHSPGIPITKNICSGTLIQFPIGTSFLEIPSMYLMGGLDDAIVPWTGYGRYVE